MAAVTDGYTLLASWDERVKTAMKEARQEQHLAKDGCTLGPLCPELLKRRGYGSRSDHREGNTPSRRRGGRSYPGRGAQGKENRRPSSAARSGGDGRGRKDGRARAAAPGAAAAAAAAAGGRRGRAVMPPLLPPPQGGGG